MGLDFSTMCEKKKSPLYGIDHEVRFSGKRGDIALLTNIRDS